MRQFRVHYCHQGPRCSGRKEENKMYKRSYLGLEEAKGAVEAMIKECKKANYWPYGCFAIVDQNGDLVYFARMDGAGKQGVTMAIRKAYTAALWGKSTKAFNSMIDAKKYRRSASNYGPEYTTILGGVAIIEPAGKEKTFATPFCLGGIGTATTGPGELDEAVAKIGLRYIEKKLWPESADKVPAVEVAEEKAGGA